MPTAPVTLDAEVVSDPRLRHGETIIAGTATPVRAIAELWNQGLAPEEIPIRLPHLTLRQVFAALYYYLGNRQDINAYIAANRVPDSLSSKHFDPATGKVH
jgi:uncharacterized protein (DUF433 family)